MVFLTQTSIPFRSRKETRREESVENPARFGCWQNQHESAAGPELRLRLFVLVTLRGVLAYPP